MLKYVPLKNCTQTDIWSNLNDNLSAKCTCFECKMLCEDFKQVYISARLTKIEEKIFFVNTEMRLMT